MYPWHLHVQTSSKNVNIRISFYRQITHNQLYYTCVSSSVSMWLKCEQSMRYGGSSTCLAPITCVWPCLPRGKLPPCAVSSAFHDMEGQGMPGQNATAPREEGDQHDSHHMGYGMKQQLGTWYYSFCKTPLYVGWTETILSHLYPVPSHFHFCCVCLPSGKLTWLWKSPF